MGKSLTNFKRYRVLALLLTLLVIVGILNVPVYAEEQSGRVQLHCRVQQGGSTVSLAGDTYAIAQIATINVQNHNGSVSLTYQICTGFENFDCDWNALTDKELRAKAKALEKKADALHLLDEGKKTNSDGIVAFEPLEPGLYLVTRTAGTKNTLRYAVDPFLVNIPTIVEGIPAYSVTATPKFEYIPDVDLPDTGDDNNLELWILLLGISLLGLVVIAMYNRKKRQ